MPWPWLKDLTNELLGFPSGLHDDQVDTLAIAANLTTRTTAPHPQKGKTDRETFCGNMMYKSKPAEDGSARIIPVDAEGNESKTMYLNPNPNDLFEETNKTGVLALTKGRIR